MKIEIKKMETITTQQKISQFIENQAFSQNENINLSYQSFFHFGNRNNGQSNILYFRKVGYLILRIFARPPKLSKTKNMFLKY